MFFFIISVLIHSFVVQVSLEGDILDTNKCMLYSGVCVGLLGTRVYEEHSSIERKEKIIATILPKLRKYPFMPCWNYYQDLLCYYFYTSCTHVGDDVQLTQLCQSDCLKAKSEPCNWVGQFVPEFADVIKKIDCDSLVINISCRRPAPPAFATAIKKLCKVENEEKVSYPYKINEIQRDAMVIVDYSTRITIPDLQLRNEKRMNMKPLDPSCTKNNDSVEAFVSNIDVSNTLTIKNIKPLEFSKRHIMWFCELKNRLNYTEALVAPVGTIKHYTPDKYLTLKHISLFYVQDRKKSYIRGAGTHLLCGIKFHYTILPLNKRHILFHATSNAALPFLLIKSSTKMRNMPVEIQRLIKHNYDVSEEESELKIKINNLSWNILWYGVKKLTAFKGFIPHTNTLHPGVISGTDFEIMIGDEQRFTVMKMEVDNLRPHHFLFMIDSLMPDYLREHVLKIFSFDDDVMVKKMEYILSTGNVDIPYCKYLRKHYKLARNLPKNRLKLGLWLKLRGTIIEPHRGSKKMVLADRGSEFIMEFTHVLKYTTFTITFDVPRDLDCQKKKKKVQEWLNFEKLAEAAQKQTKLESNTTKKSHTCTHCCKNGMKSLLSIRGKFYVEGLYEELEFVDLDIVAVDFDSIFHYQLRKFEITLIHMENIASFLPKSILDIYTDLKDRFVPRRG